MKKRIASTALVIIMAFIASVYPHASADTGKINEYLNEKPTSSTSAPVTPVAVQPPAAVPVLADGEYMFDNTNREMRGTWIATVKNINMPSAMDEAAFKSWAEQSLELLRTNGFNAVVFQVRPTGDALYKSALAPWSSFITGKAQGTDPGYDPLQIMIDTAHSKGIELHAWINPYRITMPSDKIEAISANNVAKLHPDWLVKYGAQYYLNPGIPEVRTHLVAVVDELVKNYDVDAVHIDDYFYPYAIAGQTYGDATQFATYGAGYANVGDWRRDNVTNLVRDIYKNIKQTKSYVQLGVSPFGVWRNITTDPTGSNTNAGHECYDSLYADTRKWISEGIIDYITPQIYWSTAFEKAKYETLVSWWQKEIDTYATTKPVNLYIGLADYKVADNADAKWMDASEIANQVNINRLNPTVLGQMHYSFNSVKANSLNHISNLKANQYAQILLTPAIYDTACPSAMPVMNLTAAKNGSNIALTIGANDVNTRKFIIYRFDGNAISDFNSANLLAVVYKANNITSTIYNDLTAISGHVYTYAVKAVSASGTINNSYKTTMITG